VWSVCAVERRARRYCQHDRSHTCSSPQAELTWRSHLLSAQECASSSQSWTRALGTSCGRLGVRSATLAYAGLSRRLPVVGRCCRYSSFATLLSASVGTTAFSRGCFANTRAFVSAGVRGGFRALTGVVVLAAVRRMGPTGALAGPSQGPAGAIWCLWSFSRLWVAVINRHSARAADLPLRCKRSMPRLNFVCPNTGSIIAWRLR
jgi:hypothetical protein